MVTIEYSEYGQSVSDFDYGDWLDDVKENIESNRTFSVSTGIPIHAIRLAICKGEIDCEKVFFKYLGETFQANEYGAFFHWPNGFASVDVDLSFELIKCARNKRKLKHSLTPRCEFGIINDVGHEERCPNETIPDDCFCKEHRDEVNKIQAMIEKCDTEEIKEL